MDDGKTRSSALAVRIGRLPHRLRVAFAAACAERALSVLEHENYSDDPGFLTAFRVAVEGVWAVALGGVVVPDRLAELREGIEAVFPIGENYSGYDGTVGAGAAVLRAVDAATDSLGRAAADVGLNASSAYEQVTQWDDEPTDDMDWQEQAVALLEALGDRSLTRESFAGLPAVPTLDGD